MKNQLADESLREDLMSNDDLREQSEELLNALTKSINDKNINNPQSADFDSVIEILSGISISRARQGYSPRETGLYIFSLKDAMLEVLQAEVKDINVLFPLSMSINKLIDNFGVITFETFIKGREEVILRQTDEITEISTPVIQLWDGIPGLPIIGTRIAAVRRW
ncbi:RsbRD N-terminal domain-containing protein [Chitinophaga sedimenti]|uniref:RsbRD N-terminal domain-containing protein n=1 Tax=Chitinophaga sedimenti TaxID=2033606 RepID=UPI0020053C4D|nr:RsbRD N-terminal domain-containing protein [Chitinophaga sedimenti]MCK7558409.1 RsbRD N-terminal domain-containing protein [Chitinophaga sedimenti]